MESPCANGKIPTRDVNHLKFESHWFEIRIWFPFRSFDLDSLISGSVHFAVRLRHDVDEVGEDVSVQI